MELPCKFRMYPYRVHPVQNGMPFCETCLSSPPRFRRFLRGVDVGKAASERALLFPHLPPKKSSETSKGDDSGFVIFRRGWVGRKQDAVSEDCFPPDHCRRKITRLQSSRPAPVTNARKINCNFRNDACYICLTRHHFVTHFVQHKFYLISAVLQTVQHCQTYCKTKNKGYPHIFLF